MGNGNDSILEAYLFETNSLLEQLDSLVLAAEEKDSFSEEDVNTIFRIMHTIKGSSAMMEYSSLMTIAHRAEDLFAIVRDKSMEIVPEALRPALFDLLFQIIDFFRGEIERIENGQPLTQTIDSLLQKVNSFIQQIQNGAAAAPAEVPPAAPEAPAPADSGPAAVPGFPYALQIFFDEGAGMDVVKQNVEAVGGTVSLTSELGKGMTTTLKIPLTTAIMDGMEVSVGGSIFTIPIHNIRQSFKIHSDQLVHDAAGGEIFKCMGSFYPVVRMRELYQIEEGCTQVEDGILIWLEAGELSYCLFVDELLGEQQVVVKPLPSYLNSFNIKRSGIAGCTILGDGNISIILDVANLYSPFR